MKQFNLQNQNAAEARRVGNELQASILEAQIATDAQNIIRKRFCKRPV